MKSLKAAVVGAVILLAPLAVTPAQAQDASSVPGVYCLVGVRETGSCMRLLPGGKWEYFLAYGAYDERSEGTWKIANGGIVVDSPPYDRRASFSFKRLQKSESGAYTVPREPGRPRNCRRRRGGHLRRHGQERLHAKLRL